MDGGSVEQILCDSELADHLRQRVERSGNLPGADACETVKVYEKVLSI